MKKLTNKQKCKACAHKCVCPYISYYEDMDGVETCKHYLPKKKKNPDPPVERIIPCVCADHAPSVDDASYYAMPQLKVCNSFKNGVQLWTVFCPVCGRGGMFQHKSPNLALHHWNELMQRCYDGEGKEVVFKEEWKETCQRLGYDYDATLYKEEGKQ